MNFAELKIVNAHSPQVFFFQQTLEVCQIVKIKITLLNTALRLKAGKILQPYFAERVAELNLFLPFMNPNFDHNFVSYQLNIFWDNSYKKKNRTSRILQVNFQQNFINSKWAVRMSYRCKYW